MIAIRVNGTSIQVPEGTSAAAAMILSGGFSRTSVSGEPRAPFCGMGTCFECRCEIDGEAHQRGCQVLCRPGMEIRADSGAAAAATGKSRDPSGNGTKAAQLHFEVVVIGGGPAGIAAASAASESGRSVALIDDNSAAGGQIWRGGGAKGSDSEAAKWLRRLRHSPVQVISGAQVFHLENGRLAAELDGGHLEVCYRELILATGARELFLPFPGWTLRGVFGAGGLQALLKAGLSVEGKRMVIAGTGPLLLAVAAYARKQGAKIVAICEQTEWKNLARFAMETTRAPGKLKDALRFGWALRRVPYWTSAWPVAALGHEELESVRVLRNGKIRELACDYLACGFHLVPNLELASFAGCVIENGFVAVDEFQRTSVRNIYCAGETTGIGGLDKSLVEGRIAGYAATGNDKSARHLFSERAGCTRFAAAMKSAFQLRQELKSLPQPETLLCRCEDVPFGRARQFDSWRAAKLHTRCGMGACQGRVCGSAAETLFGWKVDSVRPPVFAVECGSLAAVSRAGASGANQSERA
ncbi:MAG TPA: FAD-dependent oxidoreductase [Candidatus Acidoferrales bacterium]|nr:FAD-dependent oxidoreductase [Candidatus Acidoferrales bacterium]